MEHIIKKDFNRNVLSLNVIEDKIRISLSDDELGMSMDLTSKEKDELVNQLQRMRVPTNENLAVDKAMEMIILPMCQLPVAAVEYLKRLSKEVGMCIEVCITAYAHYNQAVLGMPCNDSLYIIPETERLWFKEMKYCK